MDESKLYEAIGRKQAALDDLNANFDKLLSVLAEVVSGQCDTSRVLVNLTDRTYSWSEAGTRPGTPATVNGLPHVVIDMRVSRADLEAENAMLTKENERLTAELAQVNEPIPCLPPQ